MRLVNRRPSRQYSYIVMSIFGVVFLVVVYCGLEILGFSMFSDKLYFDLDSGKTKKEVLICGIVDKMEIGETEFSRGLQEYDIEIKNKPNWTLVCGQSVLIKHMCASGGTFLSESNSFILVLKSRDDFEWNEAKMQLAEFRDLLMQKDLDGMDGKIKFLMRKP